MNITSNRRTHGASGAIIRTPLPMLVALLILIGTGACRNKRTDDATAAVNASPNTSVPVPSGDVTDGILDGLRKELDTSAKLSTEVAARVKSVQPVLKCVEPLSANEWRAHFGYANSGGGDVPIEVSVHQRAAGTFLYVGN